jgi:hypothetical protein
MVEVVVALVVVVVVVAIVAVVVDVVAMVVAAAAAAVVMVVAMVVVVVSVLVVLVFLVGIALFADLINYYHQYNFHLLLHDPSKPYFDCLIVTLSLNLSPILHQYNQSQHCEFHQMIQKVFPYYLRKFHI